MPVLSVIFLNKKVNGLPDIDFFLAVMPEESMAGRPYFFAYKYNGRDKDHKVKLQIK